MILRLFFADDAKEKLHAVLLFGSGLIGSSVLAHLPAGQPHKFNLPDWSWSERHQRIQVAATVTGLLSKIPAVTHVSIIWSAGVGGFNAPEAQLAEEFEAFRDVVSLANAFNERINEAVVCFHLVSSAGGMFEGIRMVSAADLPEGRRAYAQNKIKQEEFADSALKADTGLHIYRPSSVYGYKLGGRMNLISTLIENGYRRRTSTIYGKLSTVRDFIFVEDVGRDIARSIVSAKPTRSCHLIASGKPSCMLEVIQVVQSVVNYPLQIRYDTSFGNSLDNSYLPSIAGSPSRRTPLRLGVLKTADAWKRSAYFAPMRRVMP